MLSGLVTTNFSGTKHRSNARPDADAELAMKFGKRLRDIVDCSNPEWKPNFMSYKDLKKRIAPAPADDAEPHTPDEGPARAADSPSPDSLRVALNANAPFFAQLRHEVDKVNDFFIEKQEDFVIEHEQLSARVEALLVPGAPTRADFNRLRQRLIDFHAKLVVLENYSTVNYTGFRKILKKHDKKTGLSVRSTALRNVSATPFFVSDISQRLLLATERQIADLDSIRKFRRATPESDSGGAGQPETAQGELSPSSAASGRRPPPVSEGSLSLPERMTGVVPAPPPSSARPGALVARTPLLRLYQYAAPFARTPAPLAAPQPLVDAADGVSARELGLTASFLRSQTDGPKDFRIAAGDELVIGFYLLPAGATLQLFDLARPAAVVSRLVHGRARMRVLRRVGGTDEVEEVRSADAVGPWPSISAVAGRELVEWTAERRCAVLYVACPPAADARLVRYRLAEVPGRAGRFGVSGTEGGAEAATVWY